MGVPIFPVDAQQNASYAFTYTGENLTQIDMTVNGAVYRMTFSYTGSVLDSATAWALQ